MNGDATAHARAQAPETHALFTFGALMPAAAVTTGAVSSSRSMLSDLNTSRCYLSVGVLSLSVRVHGHVHHPDTVVEARGAVDYHHSVSPVYGVHTLSLESLSGTVQGSPRYRTLRIIHDMNAR